MVFKNISRIKSALPEVKHIVMFYNNGTIFQTTFEQSINIPKLGENLAGTLNHIRSLYEICNYKMEPYRKLIFETEDISVIILKLGEDSNIALFFEREEDKELRLYAIRRYISKIENLIDMKEEQLVLEEILTKEKELEKVRNLFQVNQEKVQQIIEKLKIIDKNENLEESKQLEKQLISLNEDSSKLEKEINTIQEAISQLRQNIEKQTL
ncbi:MAG: hypothetical protein EAX91_15830 [Candidatus Lokiarchaeota archaeon]|nr:hypothetical protein [Candidatus Lokiarchaeota archaeon]